MAKDDDERRRRLERAASLRAAGAPLRPEEAAELEREDELNARRREVDPVRRADYLIRDAMARGDFDNLSYAGKPIPGLENVNDPDWWIKGLIEREQLTGIGPEALVLRTEDARMEATLDALHTELQVREALEAFNRRVIEARRQLLGGPPVVTRLRDVEEEVRAWRARRAAREAAAAAAEDDDEAAAREGRRPWWRLGGRRRRRRQ
ncbi:DUF1992 domain-containing protein [Sinomonas halotolerans]|uniref:DUF1992 domain-containing protein n=1 Tax=Sinomonas halotolerans TaxID=1644133 RepID=A0ABU9WZP0_9MICC